MNSADASLTTSRKALKARTQALRERATWTPVGSNKRSGSTRPAPSNATLGPKHRADTLAFRTLLLALPLLCIGPLATAQQIYKSVDADGVVSYSSSPPRDAPQDRIETVRVDPAPAEAERNAAQQRLSAMQRQSSGSARNTERSSQRSTRPDPNAPSDSGTSSWDAWRSGVIERSRSNSRVARPAGASSTESGRSTGQSASSRSSR